MGKNQTIIINADVIATLKGMDKVVTGLKSGLSEANTKIDFTKGIGASVSKLVDKFKSEFSKFNQLTENGELDIGNSREALKSGKNLIDTYKELQRIIGDLNSLTIIDAKKLFPDAFDQRIENASKKLKDFSSNWSRLSEKQLKLDQAKTELQVLTDKLKELEKSLVDTNTLKVNTTSAEQKVEEMINKVKELKNELKKELKLKVDTIDKDLIKNKRNGLFQATDPQQCAFDHRILAGWRRVECHNCLRSAPICYTSGQMNPIPLNLFMSSLPREMRLGTRQRFGSQVPARPSCATICRAFLNAP